MNDAKKEDKKTLKSYMTKEQKEKYDQFIKIFAEIIREQKGKEERK